MLKDFAKKKLDEFLKWTWVEFNWPNPRDPEVHDESMYMDVLLKWNLWLWESYMAGKRDCKQLDEMINKIISHDVDKKAGNNLSEFLLNIQSSIINMQSKLRSRVVWKQHYDAWNDLYKLMLDKRLVYTCAYRKNANNIDDAQEAKLKLICDKLYLKPWMHILDIWCGRWSFAKYAAENYWVKVTWITISQEQQKLAQEMCKWLNVEIKLEDYRDTNDKYDAIVSIGMFEHVGVKNYRKYFEVAQKCLKENWLFLLHTIWWLISTNRTDARTDKYIFPGGMLPSGKQIETALESLFVVEDLQNFGAYYDKTLMARYHNIHKSRPELDQNKYDKTFRRMREYYLQACAGGFRARKLQLRQYVLSKSWVEWWYNSIR